jgi:hypothetical protein
MQHRFVGDIGDYVKISILRALAPGARLGVAWWLHPKQTHNNDGQHVDYLDSASRWRPLNPALFDHLRNVVTTGARHIHSLEKALDGLDVRFAGDAIPIDCTPSQRLLAREAWFGQVLQAMEGVELVFVDPDNGLEPASYRETLASSAKSIRISEVERLARDRRSVLVYHHQTRRKGGHLEEIRHWATSLRSQGFKTVDALRAPAYSPRVFFLINATGVFRRRAEELHRQWWGPHLTWHPDPARM